MADVAVQGLVPVFAREQLCESQKKIIGEQSRGYLPLAVPQPELVLKIEGYSWTNN
jgi:hypothetical protein